MSTETIETHTAVEAGTPAARALSRITHSTFWVVIPEVTDAFQFPACRTKAAALETQRWEAAAYADGGCVGRCGRIDGLGCDGCATTDDFLGQFPIAKIYLATSGAEHWDAWSDAYDRAVDLKDLYINWDTVWIEAEFGGRFIIVVDPVAGDGREVLGYASRYQQVVRAIGNGITISMLASA